MMVPNRSMVLEIMPRRVDAVNPIPLSEKTVVWPLLGDIAQLLFLNDYAEILWSYTAPWYKPEDSNKLMELYKK